MIQPFDKTSIRSFLAKQKTKHNITCTWPLHVDYFANPTDVFSYLGSDSAFTIK